MEGRNPLLSRQSNTEYGVELAYRLACERIAKINNIEEQCLKTGTQCKVVDSGRIVIVKYLAQFYEVSLPGVEVSLTGSQEKVSIRDKILILHYLASEKGVPLSHKLITYKEIPDGINYFPTFFKRAIKPLLDYFSKEPHLIVELARKLGGYKVDYGDAAVTIDAFSRVPITLVLWKGDKELAPEGNIIFDSTISGYLSADDIHVLCETIAWRLVRLLKAGGDSAGSN